LQEAQVRQVEGADEKFLPELGIDSKVYIGKYRPW
jgi:hypothetical protein